MTQAQVVTHLSNEVWNYQTASRGRARRTSHFGNPQTEGGRFHAPGRPWYISQAPKRTRIDRHPATGEQISIPARTRLRFTPAKALKDEVLDGPLKRTHGGKAI